VSDSEDDPQTDGEFVEALEPRQPRRPPDLSPVQRIASARHWFGEHRRGLGIALAVLAGAYATVAFFGLPGLAMAFYLGWFGLIGGSALVALVRWLARRTSRDQTIEFVREGWRELTVAAALALVLGELLRADDVTATVALGGFAYFFILAGIAKLEERTQFGQWLHRRQPQTFLAAAIVLLLLGPQFRREMTTDNCDDPNYWVQTDYQENDRGGGTPVYSCFSPEVNDYVAPRVDGRSLFGLRLSNLGLRLYSLNFSGGQFEGIGVCLNDEDCFP
jgi:hypothetical protein